MMPGRQGPVHLLCDLQVCDIGVPPGRHIATSCTAVKSLPTGKCQLSSHQGAGVLRLVHNILEFMSCLVLLVTIGESAVTIGDIIL